jgi:hypothetical protein
MVGLSVGGLIAAQSLGIALAGSSVAAFKGTVRGFGGYVGRRTTGGISRQLTKDPNAPPAGTRTGRVMQTLARPLRRAAQSSTARSFGVPQALEEHGKKTEGARATRLEAKERFNQAAKLKADLEKDKTENKLDAATKNRMETDMKQLNDEGLALVKRYQQQKKENPGLMGSTLGVAGQKLGLWDKPQKVVLDSKTLKTLSNLGQREEKVMVQTGTRKETRAKLDGEGNPMLDDFNQPAMEEVEVPVMKETTRVVQVGGPVTGRAAQVRDWAGKQQKQGDLTKAQKERLAATLGIEEGEGKNKAEEPKTEPVEGSGEPKPA